jgi:hypothetical protein
MGDAIFVAGGVPLERFRLGLRDKGGVSASRRLRHDFNHLAQDVGDPPLVQPALSDGRLFSAWPHAGRHRFGGFGPRDGRPLWETDLAHDIITAPVVCGGAVYVSSLDGVVSCVDASNGQRLASRDKRFCSVGGRRRRLCRAAHGRRGPITQSLADLPRATSWKSRRSNAPPIWTSAAERCARPRARRYHPASSAAAAKAESYSLDGAVGFSSRLRRRSKRSVRCLAKLVRVAIRGRGLSSSMEFSLRPPAIRLRREHSNRTLSSGRGAGRQSRLDAPAVANALPLLAINRRRDIAPPIGVDKQKI